MVLAKWQNINPGQDYNEWESKARPASAISENTIVNNADHANNEEQRGEVRPEAMV